MKTFNVTIYYVTGLQVRRLRRTFNGVVADSASEASGIATRMFLNERKQKSTSKARISSTLPVEINPEIQNGDKVTVPITGRIEIERDGTCVLHGRDGARLRMRADQVEHHTGRKLAKPVTVEYLSLYPHDDVYRRSRGPVKTSQYGVENLIQIKVTRQGGKIIAKEFV